MVSLASKTGHCPHRFDVDQAVVLDLLVSQLTDFAIFVADCDGCLQTWNPGVERLLGYTESEWLGQSIAMIFTPEDRRQGQHQEEMKMALTKGNAPDIRWHQRRDGSRLFVEGTMVGLRNDSGKLIGFAKVMRDLTERKNRESQLREAKEHWQTLFDAISEGSFTAEMLFDETGRPYDFRFLEVNPAFERLTGLIEATGKTVKQLLPGIQEELIQTYATVVETGQPAVFELQVSSLQNHWYELRARPLAPHCFAVLFLDITERKLAEQERERLTRELRRSNDELSQFAHMVSHDLQAPIRGVMSFAQLLHRNTKELLVPRDAELLNHVIESASAMQNLVGSLLKFAQVGQGDIDRQPVSMEAVLEGALQALSVPTQEAKAIVEHSELPIVHGDLTLLTQLLQNLIGNAIKYHRPGEPPHIRIAVRTHAENHWLFAVQDNGEGIPQSDLKSIFTPLKRLHDSSIPGTGLGLSMCQRIVERHGGKIWAESRGECGSTFYFTLPIV